MLSSFRLALVSAMALAALALAGHAWPARAQTTPGSTPVERPGGPTPDPEADQGIPVTSKTVQDVCGVCHRLDDQQRMSRISFRRTTPESWQQTIKRMVALDSAKVSPEQAREIVKYLATNHGLAPEELRPASFEVERRIVDYTYDADKDTQTTCNRCHSFGRVIAERRTKADWGLLVAMHRGFYPYVDFQAFRTSGRGSGGGEPRPSDTRHPMDKALDHLARVFPLKTPEWTTWSASMKPPELAGRWALAGYQTGRGPVFGQVIIQGTTVPDEFTTETRFVYAQSGQAVTRKGRVIVYTGYQWRGRSTDVTGQSAPPVSPTAGTPALQKAVEDEGTWREVMMVERDWRTIAGRWFTGAYEETGMQVALQRVAAGPIVLGVDRKALKAPSTVVVRIYGVNLPARITTGQLDFGRGITVRRVVSAQPERIDVEVQVSDGTPIGLRDLVVVGATKREAVAVYAKVDRIKVLPQAGMARVGGAVFPKMYQQFEVVAYANGPDGNPETADDLDLGPVEAQWSLEEYSATYNDEDIKYVGSIDERGLFTPNIDGPNPARRGQANNIGDVWVVGSYGPTEEKASPMRARAHLLVTVPLYMQWDNPEVAPR